MIDLSVIIPVYNAEATITSVVEGLRGAFGSKGALQIVLVNDGSSDRSHEVCARLSAEYPQVVTYLRLAKNFGEHNAVMAGLRSADGRYAVIMDDDMQNLPEDAVRLYEEARSKDYDVVYSVYDRKEHSWSRNLGSRFNGLIANYLINKPNDLYLSSFKALSAPLLREIVKYTGPYPYIDGLALRCTSNIGRLPVTHQKRAEGRSGYNLRKLVSLWLNVFVNFSVLPLRASAYLGVLSVLVSLVLILDILFERIVLHSTPPGWSYLAIITAGFSGTQLLMLGVIGEYLGRLYLSETQTPQYVVRDTHGLAPTGTSAHEEVRDPAVPIRPALR